MNSVDEFKKRFQVTPDNFKGRRSSAKNLLSCARRFNENDTPYSVRVQADEFWLIEYQNDKTIIRYIKLSEQGELLKISKKYSTFKKKYITTEALRILAKATML